jgi:FKBP-type peptidyl-prolyl cis-trans isomerase FklB
MGTSDQLAAMKAAKAEAILNEGLAFLESNKNKPGVIVLPSGLQYEIITEGSGAKPTASQTVTCHYHGTLTNGTVFDSSVKRGAPASFPLNRVISGWTEALQLMPIGSKWRLFLPPQLAYGSMQVGLIPANSTLIFEVELLSIS